MTVVVRTASGPAAFINPVKEALRRIEPDRAASGIRTMEEVIFDSAGSRRFPTLLLVAFSLVALTLAAVGMSGVVSFAVSQRTRELGIRMALGARKGDVIRLVLKRSMVAAVIGVGVGLAAAFALTRFLTGLLFAVKPLDPVVISSAAFLLASVAFIACYLPARRATKVDPMIALRCEWQLVQYGERERPVTWLGSHFWRDRLLRLPVPFLLYPISGNVPSQKSTLAPSRRASNFTQPPCPQPLAPCLSSGTEFGSLLPMTNNTAFASRSTAQ